LHAWIHVVACMQDEQLTAMRMTSSLPNRFCRTRLSAFEGRACGFFMV